MDAWLRSDRYFHAMRDWYTHTDLILAGMWGGVGNILPSPADLFRASTNWRVENDHIDQDILSDTVWPTVRGSILIHDSVFTGTLGSVPFPPFGGVARRVACRPERLCAFQPGWIDSGHESPPAGASCRRRRWRLAPSAWRW